jgi:hypothetical protein
MIVRRPQVELDADRARLRVRVESERAVFAPREVCIAVPRTHAGWLDTSGNAWLSSFLLMAATLGERLRIEAPVSPRLLAAAPHVLRMCSAWWPLAEVDVDAEPAPADVAPPGAETLSCFTRGVDSWYAALRLSAADAVPSLTGLLYVPDFDRQYAPARRREAVRRTREAADRLSLPLLVVLEHDIRELLDPIMPWDFTHGGVLAGTALALGTAVSTLVVPGTHDRAHLPPYGTHPDLDPLWSTERTTIVYDASDVTRTAKVRAVAASAIALPRLKVCWEADVDDNCGRCRKCVRTMLQLAFAGRLDGAPFAAPLTMSAFLAMPPPRRDKKRMLFSELYDAVPTDRAWDAWREALRARLSWWHPDAPATVRLAMGRTVVVEAPPGTAHSLAAPPARGVLPGLLVPRDDAAAVDPPGVDRIEVTWTRPAPGRAALPWRPTACAREGLLAACRDTAERAVPWCLLDLPTAGVAEVVRALTRAWGPGAVCTPHRMSPDGDHGTPSAEAIAIQRGSRVRVWRGDGTTLDPFRVLEALRHGCLPLQCVAADERETLIAALPRGLDAFVLSLDDVGAPLDAAAVARRLERGLSVVLQGSLERDLHRVLRSIGAVAT